MAADKHKYPSVHCGLMRAAARLLETEQPAAARRYEPGTVELLVSEAAAPDRVGDRQQGSGMHYFCAVTPDGLPVLPADFPGCFPNGKGAAAPSPLTMAEAEYRMALSLERAGRYAPALQSLARAAHMIQDICCPPHAAGLTYFSRYAMQHKRYEGQAAEIFWGKKKNGDPAAAAHTWAEAAAGLAPYDQYTNLVPDLSTAEGFLHRGGFIEICRQIATASAAELPSVLSGDDKLREASIRRQLAASVAQTAALFAAFDRDAADPSIAVWQERTPYWLYSFGAKKNLYRDPLYLDFDENGDITLHTLEGATLCVTRMGGVRLTDPQPGMKTTFRFGCEPLLTLFPAGDQSKPIAYSGGRLFAASRFLLRGLRLTVHTSFALIPDE